MKTAEFQLGIGRLWEQRCAFPELASYLGAIASLNPDGGFARYPGSPVLAARRLRVDDRLILMELHPKEEQTLRRCLGSDPRVGIHHRDGLKDLPALLPPKPARGLVLIDPPYEQVSEYERVADALVAARTRWPTGVYALWFPRLARQRDRTSELLRRIRRSVPDGLLCDLAVRRQADDYGMHGSGMLILNPPWRFEEQLRDLLPRLARVLAIEQPKAASPAWGMRRLEESAGSDDGPRSSSHPRR